MRSDADLMAKILAEPATEKIASSLGLSVDEYAQRVLFFLKNPKAEPQLTVMTPQEEKQAGVPSVDDAMAYVDGMLSGEIPMGDEHLRTRFAGFDDDERDAVTATGARRPRGPAKAPPMPGDR
jgi:hypothetical protein